MKIGILTFHRATNYGAILQAYALVSYLRSLGHDAKIVDYKPKGMGQLYASIKVPGLVKKVKRIVLNVLMLPTLKVRIEKRQMYWDYIKNVLPLTDTVEDEIDFPKLDAIFVGSDQVWSTCFTGGVDKFYWGQFDRKGAKLISYAGSAAEDMVGSFNSTHNASLLNTFDSISVREEELKLFLECKLPEKKITKVLDPTLMVGVSYFDDLVKDIKPLPKPYILIYQVIRTKDKDIQKYAKEIAKEKNWDVVEIVNSHLHIWDRGVLRISKELIDPSEFVTLYKYAEYIVTTSFHGTAFSLLFNRPFNVISVSPEVDSRAKDLLVQIGLEERMIELSKNVDNRAIEWENVNEKLRILRIPSRKFILDSLKQYEHS